MKTTALLAIAAMSALCRAQLPPPPAVGLPAVSAEERAARKEALAAKLEARKEAHPAPSLPAVAVSMPEGLAAVLDRREMRKAGPREESRRVVDGYLVRQFSDGTETAEKLRTLTIRKEVSDAVTQARARAEALAAVREIGRNQLKAGAKASDTELLAIGTDAAAKSGGNAAGVAGGILAGVLAGIAGSKLMKKP